jgi:hypothetical protein
LGSNELFVAATDVGSVSERAARHNLCDMIEALTARFDAVNGIRSSGGDVCMMVGQARVAQKRNFRTRPPADFRDLRIVGRNYDVAEKSTLESGLDAVNYHWFAVQMANILSRNALRAAPGGNYGQA